MAVREYEYRGMIAEAWDALRGDTSTWPDRAYYLEVIRRAGEPVLDIGCGTGRLLLDYLGLGVDIDGVDNSPDMLAMCRDKGARMGLAPRLYEQHVETLSLPRRYRTILVPSSTIQLVVDGKDAIAAMVNIRAHLERGGVAVASFMQLWRKGEPLERRRESSAAASGGEGTYRRLATSRYDPVTECEDTEDRFQLLVNGTVVREEVHSRTRATRSYLPDQAVALFERAGFREIEARKGFSFDPADAATTLYTVEGTYRG